MVRESVESVRYTCAFSWWWKFCKCARCHSDLVISVWTGSLHHQH